MSSFLEKLKLLKPKKLEAEKDLAEKTIEKDFNQLDVDIYQTEKEVLIYMQFPGADIKDLEISLGNDNDILIIKGKKKIPEEFLPENKEEGKWLCQETKWGYFFRQIILPQEADFSEIEAKFKKGVLFLRLPFLETKNLKKKIEISTE